MAVSKITCPECQSVLRPAKPLPPGKMVKCPECGHRFAAPDEEAPAAPLKKPKKAAEGTAGGPKKGAELKKGSPKKPTGVKAAAPEKKPAAKDDDEDEGGVYGYVKEEEVEDEDKPDIEYAPDMSTKDLRGPAVAALVQPSNALIIIGGLGFFGWLALIVLHLIPILFPIDIDDGDKTKPPKPVVAIEAALAPAALNLTVPSTPVTNTGGGTATTLPPEPKPSAKASEPYLAFILMDPSGAARFGLAAKTLIFLIMVLGMIYSAIVAFGAVRIQNLDGYGWGIAACVMAIVPFWTMYGFSACVAQLARFLFGMVLDDPFTLARAWNLAISLPMLAAKAVGIWTLIRLRSETVIKGYEYKAE